MSKKRMYFHPMAELPKLKFNTYAYEASTSLNEHFEIVNYGKKSRGGVLGIFSNYFFKCDYFYFNWIEGYADLQTFFLFLFLPIARLFGKKVLWTHHNVFPHWGSRWIDRFMVRYFTRFANYTVVHTKESYPILQKQSGDPRILYFFHPMFSNQVRVQQDDNKTYDLLIWGRIRGGKGVQEFLEHLRKSNMLNSIKIKVAGKFNSEEEYLQWLKLYATNNISIENKFVTDEELDLLHRESRVVFFPYTGKSVLNSGALVTSLPKGTPIIGPHSGAFKELAEMGLIDTYRSFDEVLAYVEDTARHRYPQQLITEFCQSHTWHRFSEYMYENLK
ncbi:glycosyltransferase [Dyadobacter sp. OTU695]|uniref:glycosyltransferase n=1 Tax=Dyadobacter sp. OTU695 TaxID=3043860 RepID=UPI00313C2202